MKLKDYLNKIDKIKIPVMPDGEAETIDDLFNNCIKKLLPTPKTLYAWDELLNRFACEKNTIYFIRKYSSDPKKDWNNIRRGFYTKYNNNFGYVYCDNFLAHYFYLMAVDNFVPEYTDFYNTIMDRQFPYGFMETSEEIPFRAFNRGKSVGINKSGWKLAHIFSVNGNDYNFDYKSFSKEHFPIGFQNEWKKHEGYTYPFKIIDRNITEAEKNIMKAHFLRLVHPINYFLVPLFEIDSVNNNIGECKELIQYMHQFNSIIYPNIFNLYKIAIMSKNSLYDSIEKLSKVEIKIKYGFKYKKRRQANKQQDLFVKAEDAREKTPTYRKSPNISSLVEIPIIDEFTIVKAYLIDGMSYRRIEKVFFSIDSQSRGGGYRNE